MHPVLFHVGNLPVRAWGVLLMFGFLLAVWRAAKNAPRYGIAPEDIWDASLFGLLGGVVGARLTYVALTWKEFAANPGAIWRIDQGGMTSFGGLIGGVLLGLFVARLRKVRVSDAVDLTAVSLPIGYAIGRVGCFLNGCCYGGACDLPWAVRFHPEHGPVTVPSHPAQLYSAFAGVAIYLVLRAVERRRKFRGQLMLLFVMLYSVYRFLVEFVREGVTADVSNIAGLTHAQVASLLFAVIAAVIYAVRMRTGGSAPVAPPGSRPPGPTSTPEAPAAPAA